MFSLATGIYQSYFAPPKLSILIIGLDGSGKTALLERIKVTDINARLDVNAGIPPSLQASYAKGAVAVKCGRNNNNGVCFGDGNIDAEHRRQPQRGSQDVGKPARVPPPLPPQLASKSRQSVEKILVEEFVSAEAQDNIVENVADSSTDILSMVPPPPLVSENDDDFEGGDSYKLNPACKNKILADHQAAKAAPVKPPRPPRHDAIEKAVAPAPVPETLAKKNSFIDLFRCPSPAKYSNSALGDEEGEYHENNGHPADVDRSDTWSTEYLANYYINYQEGEEFDVKQQRSGGTGTGKKMFPMDRIRPTLGQNLAKLDLCGCKCSLFDLSGAEKMRPLWERYYRDTDAIVYVINAAETSFSCLHQSHLEFEQMCKNQALARRIKSGLPVLVFANQLDVAYEEYAASMEKAKDEQNGRGISWNDDEEDDFVGGNFPTSKEDGCGDVSTRVVDFQDLVKLFGISQSCELEDRVATAASGNIFLFGGSAKSGEGVRAAMEFLVAHAKNYHLARQAQR